MTALFIRPEGGGPSWQVWPAADSIPPGQIQETRTYLFELTDADDPLGADLLLDDLPAEALRSRDPRLARWRWSPGFHAGTLEAVLKLPGTPPRRFEIVTDPDLRKLTRDDFDAMVREILSDTFALFSLSAFRKGIARGAASRPPAIARLEFLRSRVSEIEQVLRQIARNPRRFLRGEDETVPYWRAIRATAPEILRSFRTGRVRTETARPARLPPVLKGLLPEAIILRQRRSSLDIPEHRQIKACLRSWTAWLSAIADLLDRTAGTTGDSEARTATATWAVRTARLSRQLGSLSALPLFAEVGEGPARVMLSAVFRNDPAYRRFYRLYQDMNLGLAALFGDFLQMPLARTFELYELWCFLRLVRAAAETYGPAGLDVSALFITDAAGGVTIAAGAVLVPVGGGYALCFKREYREFWLTDDRRGSFSRTMTPDMAITQGAAAAGEPPRLIVLDAKYRISQGLNDALSSIHTYRDALVQEASSRKTEGIVTAAYLLTPHVPELAPTYEDTQLPGRLFHPAYRERFRFGAVTLRPGMSVGDIGVTLRAVVADATP
jgi:hypothetical protein